MPTLRTLLYFFIFKYPLTREEIFDFSDVETIEEVDNQLSYLMSKKVVFQFGNYFSLSNSFDAVKRREKGNLKANAVLPKAKKVSKLISKFPYVENVSISGSLSKNYYDEDGDFDFFIITTPNRLWVSRTLLILYKKIFLFNSRKHFCVNYFISSNALPIVERNRFTATEIATLLPIYGKDLYAKFIKENQWSKELFPNKKNTNTDSILEVKKPVFSKAFESILNTKIGDYFDETFRKITLKKWKVSFDDMNEEDFKIAMKSTKNVSKHHPQNFQRKVIDDLEKKYIEITEKYSLEYS